MKNQGGKKQNKTKESKSKDKTKKRYNPKT